MYILDKVWFIFWILFILAIRNRIIAATTRLLRGWVTVFPKKKTDAEEVFFLHQPSVISYRFLFLTASYPVLLLIPYRLPAATSAVSCCSSYAAKRNCTIVVVIASPETITETGLIARAEAIGKTASVVAVGPVISASAGAAAAPGTIASTGTAAIAATAAAPVIASAVAAPVITSVTSIITTHMIDLL